jgi:ATP-binding protein involved in chromosome partitioning
MVGEDEISKTALRNVVSQAVRQIAIRNANMPKTETINVVA